MVKVEMGDGDRVDPRPPFVGLAQAGEHSRPAIEEEPAFSLDEIARLRATCVGPGG